MEKIVEVENLRLVIATMPLEKYWEISELEKRTGDKILTSKSMILHSIVSWNVVDEKGNPVPITIENIGKYVGLNCLVKIDEAMTEVNDLPAAEKKTSLKPSAPESTTETGADGTTSEKKNSGNEE